MGFDPDIVDFDLQTASLLGAMHDLVPAYIAYVDTDLRYLAANRMYQYRFGRPHEQILGRLVKDVTGPAFENIAIYLRGALAGVEQSFEPLMISVHGERTLSVRHLPHRDAGGRVVGVVVFGYDITEQRKAEAALVQNEKLAAAGRLASSIAHEINNPLEAVTQPSLSDRHYGGGRPAAGAQIHRTGATGACARQPDHHPDTAVLSPVDRPP